MILVIGGAGYIGSHAVKELIKQQYRVVILDNLSSGHRASVDPRAVFEYGDYTNLKDLERVLARYSIDAVMYFAREGFEESLPQQTFVRQGNKLTSIRNLLQMMIAYEISSFVFSSTTFVQGSTKQVVLHEQVPLSPLTPNAYLNAVVEKLLEQLYQESGLYSISLRYFNAAGAHESGEIGEDHNPEVHLIPQVLRHLLHHTPFTVQTGYNTNDGTYIRDYVHVTDIARAHVLALEQLLSKRKQYEIYTLGTGKGFSVKQIIDISERITGKRALVKWETVNNITIPASLIVSSRKAYKDLAWKKEYNLEEMIESAWKWQTKYPNGYASKLEFSL